MNEHLLQLKSGVVLDFKEKIIYAGGEFTKADYSELKELFYNEPKWQRWAFPITVLPAPPIQTDLMIHDPEGEVAFYPNHPWTFSGTRGARVRYGMNSKSSPISRELGIWAAGIVWFSAWYVAIWLILCFLNQKWLSFIPDSFAPAAISLLGLGTTLIASARLVRKERDGVKWHD